MRRFQGFENLLNVQSMQYGDRPAFCYAENGERIRVSYAQWKSDVLKRKEQLAAEGHTCIGILADGSYDCVCEIFAANLAGLQIVMLERTLPAEELRQALRHTDADCLYGNEDRKEELKGALTDGVTDGRDRILFFTSGTTSRSKAVVLTGASLMSSAYNGGCMLPLDPEDVLLCVLPLAHVFGFVCGMLWGLTFGSCIALSRGPRHYIDDCMYFKPTVISAVPLLIQFFLKYKVLNSELKTVLIGAGDCSPAVLQAVKALGIRVSFGYGMTETSSGTAISVGEDPLAMSVCPDDTVTLGEDGEILIEAPTCVMQGYYKDPESTAAVIRDGIVHTGDLGRFDENGYLYIIGRKKEVLVFADGTKIFLPEYEAGLASVLPQEDFAVLLKDGKAVLALRQNGKTKREILDVISPVMRNYARGKQIADVLFMQKPLPRTASGKIKRWELQKEIDVL